MRSPPLAFLLSLALIGAWIGARPPPARAAEDATPCAQAMAAAERAQRTPPKLLAAIGLVESGRPDPRTGRVRAWPWTINVGGVGRFFETKAEAVAAVAELQARGVRSIDVGCMQVNLMHHPNAFASLDEAFEPQANAAYAARFLVALYHDLGTWPRATAAYHSQTEALGTDYARKVMAVWGHPMPMPLTMATSLAAEPSPSFAAFASATQQYRAFAPPSMLFGAFAGATALPGAFRGFAGVPETPSKPARTARR